MSKIKTKADLKRALIKGAPATMTPYGSDGHAVRVSRSDLAWLLEQGYVLNAYINDDDTDRYVHFFIDPELYNDTYAEEL